LASTKLAQTLAVKYSRVKRDINNYQPAAGPESSQRAIGYYAEFMIQDAGVEIRVGGRNEESVALKVNQ
jgi:hypothetical protein